MVVEASNLGGELWMQVDDGNLVAECALVQALDINLASTGSVEILSASSSPTRLPSMRMKA